MGYWKSGCGRAETGLLFGWTACPLVGQEKEESHAVMTADWHGVAVDLISHRRLND